MLSLERTPQFAGDKAMCPNSQLRKCIHIPSQPRQIFTALGESASDDSLILKLSVYEAMC